MLIGFFLSTLGGSPLVGGLERGLAELGHWVEPYEAGSFYDLVVICNQTAHNPAYVYPDFNHPTTPICFVDSAEYGYFRRLPSNCHLYWNTFTADALNHDTKNREQQLRLKGFLEGRSFPYFIREYFKSFDFPPAYHPIDYPLYHLSHCSKIPNRDEYLSRDLDLYLAWGASHPWREHITQALRDCHVKAEIYVIEQDGPRLPQAQYFNGMERARCTVSFDGYGSGSFRMMEALVRTVLVQGPTSIHFREPLTDSLNCIEYNVLSDGEQFIDTDVCAAVRFVLENPDAAFDIYEAGYWHAMVNYTEKATAEYLLRTVEQHDWSKPTEI